MNPSTPLNCQQCAEQLADFLDRELSAEEVKLVEGHLDRCGECAREFRFEGAVMDSLKATLRRVQAPPSLLEKIRAMLGT